jgi:hypothetical protein
VKRRIHCQRAASLVSVHPQTASFGPWLRTHASSPLEVRPFLPVEDVFGPCRGAKAAVSGRAPSKQKAGAEHPLPHRPLVISRSYPQRPIRRPLQKG